MRGRFLGLLLIPVAAGAWLLLGPSRRPATHTHDTKAVAAEQAAATARDESPSAPDGNSTRPAANAPDPAALSLSSEADLRQYLDGIEGAARTRNEVRPDDFRRGGAAIARLEGVLGRDRAVVAARAFGQRLAALSRAIERRPITDELDQLASAMQSEQDESARQKLEARYHLVAERLPQLERLEAMGRLQRVASQP